VQDGAVEFKGSGTQKEFFRRTENLKKTEGGKRGREEIVIFLAFGPRVRTWFLDPLAGFLKPL
jgi:hypothetical protein